MGDDDRAWWATMNRIELDAYILRLRREGWNVATDGPAPEPSSDYFYCRTCGFWRLKNIAGCPECDRG